MNKCTYYILLIVNIFVYNCEIWILARGDVLHFNCASGKQFSYKGSKKYKQRCKFTPYKIYNDFNVINCQNRIEATSDSSILFETN
jgi:hypothetical protein